jgi:hypothetical protein
MSLSRRLLFAVVIAAAASTAQSQAPQWKWRDSGGQVHVSDLPPPREIPEKDILGKPSATPRYALPPAAASAASASSSAALSTPKVDPELEARRKQAEQEQNAKKKSDDAARAAAQADNCERAKAQVRSLESGMRVARINDKGEREILTDKDRAAEIQRSKQIMASDCQ